MDYYIQHVFSMKKRHVLVRSSPSSLLYQKTLPSQKMTTTEISDSTTELNDTLFHEQAKDEAVIELFVDKKSTIYYDRAKEDSDIELPNNIKNITLPLFQPKNDDATDSYQQLEQKLSSATHVIVIYNKASFNWLIQHLSLYIKLRAKCNNKFEIDICTPNPEKLKHEINSNVYLQHLLSFVRVFKN